MRDRVVVIPHPAARERGLPVPRALRPRVATEPRGSSILEGPSDDLDRSLLSIVVPIYNEEENLPELRRRLCQTAASINFRGCEFVLVSDGSTDGSERMIAEFARQDGRFRGICLTRNFGHQAAVSTALEHARGSVVAVIDGDLQDPPEAIPALIEALARGADVSYGVRTRRKESLPKRLAYHTFYRLLRSVSSTDIPLDSGDFCCMRRQVVDAMLALPERNRFLRGLRAWVGFRQVGVEYERAARFAGTPKYTFNKLMALAYDGIFSFSRLPVRLLQIVGFVASCLAIVVALGYLTWAIVSPERFPTGFASLIISIWFLAGVQLLGLGLVGEYIVRTCEEARARPVALIREVIVPPEAGVDCDAEGSPRVGHGGRTGR